MSYGNSQQMLLSQLQNMMSQMAGLMQQASSIPMQETTPALPAPPPVASSRMPRKIQSVNGIESAREEQNKLEPGESAINLASFKADILDAIKGEKK